MRDLSAAGVTLIWTSPWHAYVNVYFADAFDMPRLPFVDVDEDRGEVHPDAVTCRLTRHFRRRPFLWVTADAGPDTAAALRRLRGPTDSARTRLFVPDRFFGITASDVAAMDSWLELTSTEEGQEELG